jgi:branched-chain amino acid transport system permease protein
VAATASDRRGVPRGLRLSVGELAGFAVIVVAAVVVTDRFYVDILISTFLWAGLALAWNLAGGFTGLLSFGHAAFFGLSAYTSALLLVDLGVSPWIGMWAGALAAAVLGAALTLICARLRGPFFTLATLAVGEVVRIAALNWRGLTRGGEGLEIPPMDSLANMIFFSKRPYLALVLGYLVAVFLLSRWIERSRFGYYLFATRDDEDAAAAAGVNPLRVRVQAMALSAFVTGIGGTLFAQYFLFLDPTHVISPEISFNFAVICVIGGLGTTIGPVLGAFLIVPVSELLRAWLGGGAAGLHLAIYGAVLLVVILYFPEGLAGALGRLRRRRVAGQAAAA